MKWPAPYVCSSHGHLLGKSGEHIRMLPATSATGGRRQGAKLQMMQRHGLSKCADVARNSLSGNPLPVHLRGRPLTMDARSWYAHTCAFRSPLTSYHFPCVHKPGPCSIPRFCTPEGMWRCGCQCAWDCDRGVPHVLCATPCVLIEQYMATLLPRHLWTGAVGKDPPACPVCLHAAC